METMIWLVGVGNIGSEYAKVLDALHHEYIAIGRGQKSATEFEQKASHKVIQGGLSSFLASSPQRPQAAIVAVNTDQLTPTAIELMNYGVQYILLEKPGVGKLSEIDILCEKAEETGSTVVLAYNRRFYSSVLRAEEIMTEDGGVTSCYFEFTEWTHTIDPKNYSPVACRHWLLGNSSHVIDTAFFLAGQPVDICAFRSGEGKLEWHPNATNFVGAGITDKGALFSYGAAWQSPGRWVIEILTRRHRLYFKPMETLQIQELGSVAVNPMEIDNHLDTRFKPGFYLQTKAFIDGDLSRFCTVSEQKQHIDNYYMKISGYNR